MAEKQVIMEYRLQKIQPHEVQYVYPLVKNTLWNAIKRSDIHESHEDVLNELFSGGAQLWVAGYERKIMGAVITRLELQNKRKVCNIAYLAGEKLNTWIALESTIIDWARFNECERLVSRIRKGLWRFLKHRNYEIERKTDYGFDVKKELNEIKS